MSPRLLGKSSPVDEIDVREGRDLELTLLTPLAPSCDLQPADFQGSTFLSDLLEPITATGRQEVVARWRAPTGTHFGKQEWTHFGERRRRHDSVSLSRIEARREIGGFATLP